jgi:hypothetical protein
MTAPAPSFRPVDTTGGLEWVPALRDILDGGGDGTGSSLILGRDWIVTFDDAGAIDEMRQLLSSAEDQNQHTVQETSAATPHAHH